MPKQKRRRGGTGVALVDEPVKTNNLQQVLKTESQTGETKTTMPRKRAKMEAFEEDMIYVEDMIDAAAEEQNATSHHAQSMEFGDAAGPSSSSTGFLNLPGFRFSPKDDELVGYWLRSKCDGILIYDVISVVNLYAHEPWELPDMCKLGGGDVEWYFFTYRGAVTNRGTKAGYWKATGRDREIEVCGRRMGMKKTLVFYKGRAPNGDRTDWVMHEYRMEEAASGRDSGWVVCRVTDKTGLPAQRNARQRGIGGVRVEEAYNLLHSLQPLPTGDAAAATVEADAATAAAAAAADTDLGHRDVGLAMEEDQALAVVPLPAFPTLAESHPTTDFDFLKDFKAVFQTYRVTEESLATFKGLPPPRHALAHGDIWTSSDSFSGPSEGEEAAGTSSVRAVNHHYDECRAFGLAREAPIDLEAVREFDCSPPASPAVVIDLTPALSPSQSLGTDFAPAEASGKQGFERLHVDDSSSNLVDLMCGAQATTNAVCDDGEDDGCACSSGSEGLMMMVGDDFEVEELLALAGSTTGNDDEEFLMEGLSSPPIADIDHWLLPEESDHF